MRARFAILKSGQRVLLREVLLREKPPSLLSVSPKGTVPVLVLNDGTVFEESLEIMQWALAQNDPDAWLDETGLELVSENDASFKKALDRYKYFDRHPENPQLYYREKAEVFIQKLEKVLSTSTFLAGEEIRFVDVAIFPFIRQFASIDLIWFESSRYIHVRRWLQTFIKSPLFEQSMVKYDQWHSNENHVIFPRQRHFQ
ncbi:MAG: glutathione S-transferase [Oceanicoccus sp.]|jgi:glutathione S-transferase